jgi:hypothetical protein
MPPYSPSSDPTIKFRSISSRKRWVGDPRIDRRGGLVSCIQRRKCCTRHQWTRVLVTYPFWQLVAELEDWWSGCTVVPQLQKYLIYGMHMRWKKAILQRISIFPGVLCTPKVVHGSAPAGNNVFSLMCVSFYGYTAWALSSYVVQKSAHFTYVGPFFFSSTYSGSEACA